AVRVRNIGKNSRWYSGSGIYRHVKLVVTDTLHIDQWGVQVTTVGEEVGTTVKVSTNISNEQNERSDIKITTKLIDANHKTVGESETSSSINAHDKTQ